MEVSGDQRLMITKIVCQDFKSYAGIKELGPFHKCFTSIVGPNGSGKSNVIDSMLFVFGYRAKKIRSKSVSVLIHNSDNHQNIQSCTVSVHFQKIIDLPGDEQYSVVPGSQFVVSRTAHKDNSSYYQLNGRKVPFKEIALLLRESGIDLDHNRFLILQGEVEQIALMKPKALTEHDEGMLEFLEDIIGTSQYKEPIEEMGTKVELLNEKRGEKLNRVKAVEKEKNALEGAKREAEEFLSLKKEAALKKYKLFERYKHECGQLEAKAREKKEELDERVKEMKASVTELTKGKEEKMKEQKKLYKKYEQQCKENEKFKSALSLCEQRDTRIRQDIKNSHTQCKKTGKALNKEKEKLADLELAPERNEKEIMECEKKLIILKQRKVEEEERLTAVMSSLKEDTQELQDEKESLERELVGLSQKSNQAKSKLDVAQAELDLYRDNILSGERQINSAKEQLQNVLVTAKDKQSELEEVLSVLPQNKEELSRCESELNSVTGEVEKLTQLLRTSRTQVEEARSSLQSHKSRGEVMEFLMRQKSTGAIPGIVGRLGDLGSIDDRYDVAISTACASLDHTVVDTMDTAVKCVEALKRANVGSTTFIGLDKVEVWRKRANTKIDTPEDVPRLIDLIRIKDPKYLPAFYFALSDTLVAKDMDQATRIGLQGKKRYRVVTLGGQLIDSSGTMSGGGNKVLKGRMSSKVSGDDVSPSQLVTLEEKLKADESKAQEYVQRKTELEQRIKELKKDITDSERKIKQLKREIQVLSEQEKGLNDRISELEVQNSHVKIDQKQLDKLEKQVKSYQKAYETAASAAGEVDERVKSIHEEIMRIGGSRIQAQQDQVDKIDKELKDTSAVITKCTVAIKTAQRNTKKTQDKVSSLEDDVAKIEKRIEELHEELRSLEEEAKEIVKEQEATQERMKEFEEEMVSLKEEIETVEKEERQTDEQLVDLKHGLEQYAAKVKENRQKIKHFDQEITALHLEKEEMVELTEEELSLLDKKEVEYQITMLEETLKQMSPNMAAIEEYRKKEALHNERLGELEAITGERDSAKSEFENLRKRRLEEFMAGFSIITSKLKEMYQMITLGGDAELELVDSLDPFSEGIVFSVRPPKKSWKNISNLSGGEKTLSSLALVFALHHYKPSPLYVMDEIDAALDFKNVSIVANYIKERTKNAQFIIISLRNNMFELADRLVGIYKTDNCTKSVTINPHMICLSQSTISSSSYTAVNTGTVAATANVLATEV